MRRSTAHSRFRLLLSLAVCSIVVAFDVALSTLFLIFLVLP